MPSLQAQNKVEKPARSITTSLVTNEDYECEAVQLRRQGAMRRRRALAGTFDSARKGQAVAGRYSARLANSVGLGGRFLIRGASFEFFVQECRARIDGSFDILNRQF